MPEKNFAVLISSNYVIVLKIVSGRQSVSDNAMQMAGILCGYIKCYNWRNFLKNMKVTFITGRC